MRNLPIMKWIASKAISMSLAWRASHDMMRTSKYFLPWARTNSPSSTFSDSVKEAASTQN